MTRAWDRVEWAKQMFEKGYVSKSQLDAELANYEAVKARTEGKSQVQRGQQGNSQGQVIRELLQQTQGRSNQSAQKDQPSSAAQSNQQSNSQAQPGQSQQGQQQPGDRTSLRVNRAREAAGGVPDSNGNPGA